MKTDDAFIRCGDCGEHRATVKVSSEPDTMPKCGLAVEHVCLCCYVERTRLNLEGVRKNYLGLVEKLKEEGCK